MSNITDSLNGRPIRLTDERWKHISIGHPEMAEYYDQILDCIRNPEVVYVGNKDEFLAVKPVNNERNKFIVVVYKEEFDDGFVITAFITNKLNYLITKQILWKR